MEPAVARKGEGARAIAWRFGVAFGALCILLKSYVVVRFVPLVGSAVADAVQNVWGTIGIHVSEWIGVDVPPHSSGSGDSLVGFVQLGFALAVAAVVTTTWSIAVRGRNAPPIHPRLAEAGHVVLRGFLAVAMLRYGVNKILPAQFGRPNEANMFAVVGEKSPMGMLWTFMAVSRPYQVITGAVECAGGVLLLWRRTTLLGAFVVVVAMINVVALNFCYDVPVKVLSVLLLLGALALIAPEARRLLAVVLTPRAGTRPRWPRYLLEVGKVAVVVWMFFFVGGQLSSEDAQFQYGWEVDAFERDGATLPATAGDPERWKQLFLRSSLQIRTMDGVDHFHVVTHNNAHNDGKLELGDHGSEGSFTIELNGEHAVLTGTYEAHRVRAELHRFNPEDTPLLSRGFHLVQDHPFNR